MKESIPAHLITTATISKKIEGQDFDFTVTFTVFGEVLEVQIPFLALPDYAKKLIIGKENLDLLTILTNHSKLFKFFMPLVALGYLKENQWMECFQKIQHLKHENPTFKDDYSRGISDEWVKELHQLAQAKPNDKLFKNFVILGKSDIAKTDSVKTDRRNAIFFLRGKHPNIPSAFLNALFPTLTIQEEIELGYAAYSAFPSKENYSFLKNRLENIKYKKDWRHILSGMIGYTFPGIEAFLFKFYNEHIENNGITKEVISCLRLINTNEVLKFLKEAVSSGNLYARSEAVLGLKENKVPQSEIAQLINCKLRNPKDIKEVEANLGLLHQIENKDLYLNSSEFIDILEWAIEKKDDKPSIRDIAGHLKYHLEGRVTPKDYTRLINLLKNGNEVLQDGILIILSKIGLEEHMELILSFLDKDNPTRTNLNLRVVKDLIHKFPTKEVIAKLIAFILVVSGKIRTKTLEILVVGLIENPIDAALPFVFEELKSKEEAKRLLAVKALTSFRGNGEVIEQLKQMLKDPSKKIQEQVDWTLRLMNDEKTVELEQRQKLFNLFKEVMSWTNKEEKVLTEKEKIQKEAEQRLSFEKIIKEDPSFLNSLLKQKDFK